MGVLLRYSLSACGNDLRAMVCMHGAEGKPVLILTTPEHFGLLLAQKVRKGNLKLQVEVLDVVERFAQQNGLPAFDDIGVTFLDVSL